MFRHINGDEWWASIKWCYLIESSSWTNRQPIWIWMAFHCWAFSSPNRLNHLICYFLMLSIDSNDDAEWIKPENLLQTQYFFWHRLFLPSSPPPPPCPFFSIVLHTFCAPQYQTKCNWMRERLKPLYLVVSSSRHSAFTRIPSEWKMKTNLWNNDDNRYVALFYEDK